MRFGQRLAEIVQEASQGNVHFLGRVVASIGDLAADRGDLVQPHVSADAGRPRDFAAADCAGGRGEIELVDR